MLPRRSLSSPLQPLLTLLLLRPTISPHPSMSRDAQSLPRQPPPPRPPQRQTSPRPQSPSQSPLPLAQRPRTFSTPSTPIPYAPLLPIPTCPLRQPAVASSPPSLGAKSQRRISSPILARVSVRARKSCLKSSPA